MMENTSLCSIIHITKDYYDKTVAKIFILLLIIFTTENFYAQQDTVRIMPLGDSITFDLYSGDTTRTDGERIAYRYSLYQLLNNEGYVFDFVGSQSSGYDIFPDSENEGHGAVTDIWVANRVYNFLVDNPADVVLLHIGTNSLDTNAADVEFLLDEIDRYESDYGKDVWVVLAKIINRSAYSLNTTLFNNNIEAMANARINDPVTPDKIKIVDMENGAGIDYQLAPIGDMIDNLHPTPTGYTKIANVWYAALQNILPPPVDPPPVINSNPVLSSSIGANYSYDVEASGDSITYALTAKPIGMTINANSGLIEWLPTTAGEFDVTVSATNSGGENTQSFTISVYDGNDCPTGIVHHWRLDETNGTIYIDTYGENELLANNIPTPVNGLIDGAQNFDGILDGIYTNDVGSFQWNSNSSFTIEYWMKTPSSSSAAGNEVLIGCDDAVNSTHWWSGIWSGGKAAFVLIASDGSGNGQYLTGTSDLTDGDWHHVVITRNGTTNTSNMFIDGVLEDSKVVEYTATFSSTAIVTVGWLNLGGYYRFEGSMDDIGIYNTELSLDEINLHYTNGKAGYSFCDKFAPILKSTAKTSIEANQLYSYDVNAIGNSMPTYSLTTSPAGMTIDDSTGLIEWTPTVAGIYSVVVEISNSEGSINHNFNIEVNAFNSCPADLAHYWKFDDANASSFLDSEAGLNAIVINAPDSVNGKVNDAISFNGISDEIDLTSDASFNWSVSSSFSIAYWIKTPSLSTASGNEVIFGRDDKVNSTHWWGGIWSGGSAAFILIADDNSGNGQYLTGTTDLTDGNWHHVVVIRDASSNTNKLYVDGNLEDSKIVNYTSGFTSTENINIGYLNLGGHYRFEGALDELSVFDKALNETEVKEHYYAGDSNYGICELFAPIVKSTAVTEAEVGSAYSYDVEAGGNPGPTYSLAIHPVGMSIDENTGVINWIPTSQGTVSVSVMISNSMGTVFNNFDINVSAVNTCPADITHHWTLDSRVGGEYTDNQGGLSIEVLDLPDSVSGQINSAVDFNGTSNEMFIQSNTDFDWTNTSSFTFSYWMKTPSSSTAAGNEVIIGRDDNSNATHWWSGIWNGGKAAFVMIASDGSGNSNHLEGNTDITDGEWHHIVVIRNGSNGTNYLYVDGVLEDSRVKNYTAGFNSSQLISVGYLNLLGHYRFEGTLDDISYYEKAFTDYEVVNLYLNTKSGDELCLLKDPQVISIPVSEGYNGAPYSYKLEVIGNPAPTLTKIAGPAGLTLDPQTGLIEWLPDADGSFAVDIQLSNSEGTVNHQYNIDISTQPNYPPYIQNSIADFSFNEDNVDSSIVLANVFADSNVVGSISYSAVSSANLSVEIKSELAHITPTENWFGTQQLIFTATDQDSLFISDTVNVTVNSVNDSPEFTNLTTAVITIGSPFNINLANLIVDVDNNIEDITFSNPTIIGNGLNVTIDNGMDKLTLEADSSGEFKVVLKAEDNENGSGLDTLNVIVLDMFTKQVVVDEGWNMISVPLLSTSMEKDSLFTSSISQAYAYNDGYTVEDTLKLGVGYWLKFGSPDSIDIQGAYNSPDSISVFQGWNMIGPFYDNVSIDNVVSGIINNISSQFYGFDDGYVASSVLVAGKSYWVKVYEDDFLYFNSVLSKTNNNYFVHEDIDFNGSLLFADNKNQVKTLKFSDNNDVVYRSEIPPLPPAEIFDVRFSSNRIVEDITTNKIIQINSKDYPITVKAIGATVLIKDSFSGEIFNVVLNPNEKVVLQNAKIKQLDVVLVNEILTYKLQQNYPNPFNPNTVIEFTIPEDINVRIEIYDILGQRVKILKDENLSAGYHKVVFEAGSYSSGIYFYKMVTDNFTDIKKMLLLK